jgi:hypothetical protein
MGRNSLELQVDIRAELLHSLPAHDLASIRRLFILLLEINLWRLVVGRRLQSLFSQIQQTIRVFVPYPFQRLGEMSFKFPTR